MKRGGLGRALAFLLLAFVVLAGFFLASIPQGVDERDRSAFSSTDRGRLGVFLLLRELGFAPRAWRDAPGDLPRGRFALWLPEAPREAPDYLQRIWDEMDEAEESGDPDAERPPVTRRLRDPRHYRRFVEEGGVLVAALDDGRRAFLLDELGLERVEEITRSELESDAPQGVVTRRGQELSVGWGARRWLNAPDLGELETLVADADDPARSVVLRVPVGRGELVLLPTDELADNDTLEEGDNALLLVRVVEALGPLDGIYFDEFALGGWVPETPLELALAPGRFALTAHLALLVVLAVWSLAWASAFARDPESLGRTSPRARARSQGELLARLGRFDLLAGMLRRGVFARLPGATRRRPAPAAEPGDSRGDDDEPRLEAHEVRRALGTVEHLARDEHEVAAWEAGFLRDAVETEEELELLAGKLVRLERLARTGRNEQNAPPGP
ncbi:MAG: hypothetical protein AAF682_24690 [Planctomycetota bacterium]